ncbi:UNVERIFIED_CONTAM: hypothetical protein OHV15_12770 [Microbacterium sp. SLM126]
MTKTFPGLAGLAILAVLLAGCAAQGTDSAHDTLDLDALLEETTDFQREIVEDGVVTAAEFERALLARRECVADVGATPGDIYTGSNGELTFDYDITAESDDEALAIQRDADACLQDYFADVGTVWAYQRLLSPAEREEMRPRALACLDAAGLTELPEEATLAEMAAAIRDDGEISPAERDCLVEYGSLFTTYVEDPEPAHTDE